MLTDLFNSIVYSIRMQCSLSVQHVKECYNALPHIEYTSYCTSGASLDMR